MLSQITGYLILFVTNKIISSGYLIFVRGRVDDLSFFECLSQFCFLSIEFHCTFSIIKYYHIMFIIIVFLLGCDRQSGLLFFVPALLLSMLTPLFLPSSSVSLSYFILAVQNTRARVPHFL